MSPVTRRVDDQQHMRGAGEGPPFDAVLLVSFGGPEGPDEVMPFLENVTRGRRVPRPRLLEVAQHYHHFGGVSPINQHNRRLLSALAERLEGEGPRLPLYWGNRNWRPSLADTVAEMARDGRRRAVAFATSAYSSWSSCRQYLDDIERARAAVGSGAPRIEKIRPFWNHPWFLEAVAERVEEALGRLPLGRLPLGRLPLGGRSDPRLVFTAHSIPLAMAEGCDYVDQLSEASTLVARRVGFEDRWDLVYQSRSGPPSQPWLSPDIGDHLGELRREGVAEVVTVPIGFLSDHLEVLYDLDVEAGAVAQRLGMRMIRAETVGVHPSFVATVGDLIAEHVEGRPPRWTGTLGARPVPCPPTCCPPRCCLPT